MVGALTEAALAVADPGSGLASATMASRPPHPSFPISRLAVTKCRRRQQQSSMDLQESKKEKEKKKKRLDAASAPMRILRTREARRMPGCCWYRGGKFLAMGLSEISRHQRGGLIFCWANPC